MRPFIALVRKDLRLFFTDRRAVLMSVLAPIAIASFFGFIFGSGDDTREASRVAVVIVDEDGSTISKDLVTRQSQRGPLRDVGPEQVTARHAGHPQIGSELLSLRPFARARRTQQHDIHSAYLVFLMKPS